MLKLFTLIIIFFPFILKAQVTSNICKQIDDIAVNEMQAHYRLGNFGGNTTTNLTGASNNYDVKYYRCEWEVDPSVRYINGKVTVYFIATSNLSTIFLDLMSPLVVDSVKQRGLLLSKQQANNTVQIDFINTINLGTLDSVSIYYKGVPPNTGFGSFIQSTHGGTTPTMWSLSEPYGSRDWWPCKNGLDDKADSIDIYVTCPIQYKAASNGLLQSETVIAGGTKKVAFWKHRYPIASYLICFAVTDFAVFDRTVQLGNITLPMKTYCYPENLLSFQNGTQNTLDALQLYNNTFGDYPFIKEKYGHVQFGWGGGMEHQTCSFVVSIDESLTAHELGHQWFGDKITCGSWEDIWLNEGFATFLASFYNENKYPANTITNRKNEIANITSQLGGSVKVDDTTNVNRIFDGRLSYRKGSHLLYMLRWILGDNAFFTALKNYQKDPTLAYGFAKTADLKKHFELASGKNLTKFFNDWYSGQGYPSYQINWSQVGNNYVNIKVNETTSHNSVSFFELPIALKFKNATQEKTIVVDNKINGETFFKNIGFIADTVLIDPDYWLITKNNTATKVPDNITGANVVQIFPVPIQNSFNIYLRNFTTQKLTLNLFNAAGQLVYRMTDISMVNGSQFLEIPSNKLAKGAYNLVLLDGNGYKFTKKLMK